MNPDNVRTVMGVFKAFGAEKIPNVRLTKIGCANGKHPKIPVGQIVIGTLQSDIEVGISFNIRHARITVPPLYDRETKYSLWCTSIIQKMNTDGIFETKNSVYKFEILDR